MRRIGYLPADQPDRDPDAQWPDLLRSLRPLRRDVRTVVIAEDSEGRPVGYARSTEQDGLAELTEFFVAPDSGWRVSVARCKTPLVRAIVRIVANTDGR